MCTDHPRAHRFPFALAFAPFAAPFFFGLSSSESSDPPRALAASARFESAATQTRTLSTSTLTPYERVTYIWPLSAQAHPSHPRRHSHRHMIHCLNPHSHLIHRSCSPRHCSLRRRDPLGLLQTQIQCRIPLRRHSNTGRFSTGISLRNEVGFAPLRHHRRGSSIHPAGRNHMDSH